LTLLGYVKLIFLTCSLFPSFFLSLWNSYN